MIKTRLFAVAAICAATMGAAGAHAESFVSTFENVPGGPTAGNYTDVQTADGWMAGNGVGGDNASIELQNNVAGAPESPNGGQVFVELDTYQNSSMYRTITDAGSYSLSYLYSPRPGNSADSNGVEAFINGVAIAPGLVTAQGGSQTEWSTITTNFTATAGSILSFSAEGKSDSYGGYLDNISVSGAPEPSTWALMILGVGLSGAALRRTRPTLVAKAA